MATAGTKVQVNMPGHTRHLQVGTVLADGLTVKMVDGTNVVTNGTTQVQTPVPFPPDGNDL